MNSPSVFSSSTFVLLAGDDMQAIDLDFSYTRQPMEGELDLISTYAGESSILRLELLRLIDEAAIVVGDDKVLKEIFGEGDQ